MCFQSIYRSKKCDDVLKILSDKLNVKRNMYDIIEAYMKKNDHIKIFKKVYESNFDDYKDTDENEINNYVNKKLGEFPIHKLLQELSVNVLLWDFDAVSLYPSAMSDEKSFYL